MDRENFNVLFVDDDKGSLRTFHNLFRRKFNIITACSGEEGLEILANKPIEVIITDQRMPDMNGIDFLKKVKEEWPDLKYILLTAYIDHDVLTEAVNEAGIFWYLNKPFVPDQLEQIIFNAKNAYEAERRIKESEEKFRGVFNAMIDVFTRSDMDGNCEMVSPSIYNLIGYKPEEVLGRDLAEFYADPAERDRMIEILLKKKTARNFEFEVVRKDGKKITVSTNSRVVFDSQGKAVSVEGNIRDVTDKKKTERNLLEYQDRLKALAKQITLTEERVHKQVATDLHDEVGQLLASSRMQLAKVLELEDNPEIAIRIKSISQAILKSISATRDAIYNLSPPQLNEIGLYAAVNDWMKEQIENKFEIRTSTSGEQENYNMGSNTRFLIFRSVKELIMNVVKHAQADQLKVDFTRKKEILEITIEDNGAGFDYNPGLLKLKSDSYGLFSIQERLSDLGGSLSVESVINKGTIAKLYVALNQ